MLLKMATKILKKINLSLPIGLILVVMPNLKTTSAQEPSVIIQSLDGLENRILKIEGEFNKLKKSQSASLVPGKSGTQTDSSQSKISSRLDSMLLRLQAIETRPGLKEEAVLVSTKAAQESAKYGDTSKDEVASLVVEVKKLIAIIKSGGTKAVQVNTATSLTAPEKPETLVQQATEKPLKVATAPAPLAAGLELKGDLQIQGERKFTSASSRNNLDDFWGRLNFGAEYNQVGFQSKINIRIFPEGFGFEPLTGASFDTTGQGTLKVQSQPSSRVVVNHAWARYGVGNYQLRFGRFETMETQSSNYGNYVDLGPGGKFLARPAAHNAVEITGVHGDFAGSALLGTGDNKLNRGFLRLYEKYSFSKKVTLALGYRANFFDRFKFEKQEILQRYDVNFVCGLPQGWKSFAEVGLLQIAGKEDQTPILLGIQPNTGKVVDLLSLETEFLPDRIVSVKKKEWLVNIHARKIMGRLKVESSIASDLVDSDLNAFSFGLRLTSNIK